MRYPIYTKFEDVPAIAVEIAKIKGVKAIYLFGSRATGRALPMSDVDICVITEKENEKVESKIIGYGTENLDVSVFRFLPIAIQYRVLKEGKELVIKDIDFISRLKLYTLRKYLDFKPAINRFCMETIGCMT